MRVDNAAQTVAKMFADDPNFLSCLSGRTGGKDVLFVHFKSPADRGELAMLSKDYGYRVFYYDRNRR